MKFADLYKKNTPVISFELFPPQTERGMSVLEERLPRLIALEPSFISVTYGAMGSTQQRTLEIASKIKNYYGQEVAHHLTCVAQSQAQITELLKIIREHGIENIVALRGDPPAGEASFTPPRGGYSYADQLVNHIREFGGFGIAVGGYPEKHLEAPDLETDLQNLKRKVDSGADVIITQLFYNNRDYYAFVDRCRKMGIEKPIIPGLMPVLNVTQIKRITEMCGATMPREFLQALTDAGDDVPLVHELGIRHTAQQAQELLGNGVAGIHFYVLNRYFHIAEIIERIRPCM